MRFPTGAASSFCARLDLGAAARRHTSRGHVLQPVPEPGNRFGMSGLSIWPQDMARIGQLMLQQGRWGDEILPLRGREIEGPQEIEDALAEMGGLDAFKQQVAEPSGEWGRIVRRSTSFRADGWQGQKLLIFEELELVVVRKDWPPHQGSSQSARPDHPTAGKPLHEPHRLSRVRRGAGQGRIAHMHPKPHENPIRRFVG